MPSGGEFISHSDHMNPNGAYGSPQTLFAGNVGPSFMDAFGNIHSSPAVTDPYSAPALFGPAPGAPAAYLYQSTPTQAVANPADEIRTVFVSGFPHDVKERELHNLLRFMPGYEASQMNWKTGGPQGFALFSSSVHARAVVEILSGLQFDDGVVVRAEMAHKNMFIKPEDPSVKRATRHSPTYITPTTIMAPQIAGSAALGGAPLSPAAPAFLAAAAAAAAAAAGSPPVHNMLSPIPLRPTNFSPVTNLRDNPPCNTLFVGNLGDNTSEQELRALLSSQPGYRQMKMVRGPKSTTAFVEFADVSSAIMVHSALQGAVLASSDRGGIRVQYSKNPFGRRDVPSSSPHTPAIAAGAEEMAGLVGSPRPAAAGMPSGGGVNASSLLSNMTGGATNMVAPGSFIGQAGLDTVLGTGDS